MMRTRHHFVAISGNHRDPMRSTENSGIDSGREPCRSSIAETSSCHPSSDLADWWLECTGQSRRCFLKRYESTWHDSNLRNQYPI